VHCTEWHYRCRSCNHRFALPGADLSFSYGTFLGISPTPEAVFLEAPTDPAYAEIQALVNENARYPGMTGLAAGQLIRSVIGSVLDPDSNSAPFTFVGTPPCPRCASAQIELLQETETPWPDTISQAAAGHPVSAPVVGGLLRGPGFSLPGMARPRPVQRGSRSRVGVVRSAE